MSTAMFVVKNANWFTWFSS